MESTAQHPSFQDPRSRGFRSRATVPQVLEIIACRVSSLGNEKVDLASASGRVLGESVDAPWPVPPFDRAAMDGFAVRGEETFGADNYSPIAFRVIGRSRPGRRFQGKVETGEAVEIATGAPMPEGADAVVPVELIRLEGDLVRVTESTPPGRHVGPVGEDIEPGVSVYAPGRLLRPQDLGILSALGKAEISVVRKPRVTLLVTGDELLPPGSTPRHDRIADMNSVMVAALIERDGGLARVVGPMSDDRTDLSEALTRAIGESDAILISGGSSTGPEDHAPSILAELGELTVHGVALRPASPAGMGFIGELPVVLLPGNPVSCLCAYDFFAGPIIRKQGGRPVEWPYRSLERPLARKLCSAIGRLDYARVRLVERQVEPLSSSGASILSSTTRADGFVVVPADLEGYAVGSTVTVWLYDP